MRDYSSEKEYEKEILPTKREEFLEELPILEYKKEIQEVVRENPTVIIVGETGSGKTTQIPLFLREILREDEKVLITQPRRLAARSVARYVAKRVDSRLGEEVGYVVRFDARAYEGTKINFVTDGILLAMIQEDPLLSNYTAVMVDEAHERSLNIDFSLGLLKRIQKERKEKGLPPLKIIVSSATLEKEKFQDYFENAPLVEIPGRLYPIEIYYEKSEPSDHIKAAAQKVKEVIEGGEKGDILVFMPGRNEIEETIKEIEEFQIENIILLPLYGDLYGEMSAEEQDKIFEKTDKQKVIVATNIAETSVTVPGITCVIDSGLIKQKQFNPETGIEALVLLEHAKSGCLQRAGRAGRLAPGKCYRLYSKENFEERLDYQVPEIKRSELSHIVLRMKKLGIEDIEKFDFIDPPDKKAIERAVETLKILGALDENENLTEIGDLMAEIPLEPKVARMVIEAEEHKCVAPVCIIAAFFGQRSVFVRPRGSEEEADMARKEFQVPGSDFLTLLKVWQSYKETGYDEEWAKKNFLRVSTLKEVKNIIYQLFRVLRRNRIETIDSENQEDIGKAIASGLIENLLEKVGQYSYKRVLAREEQVKERVYIPRSSVLFGELPDLFVSAQIIKSIKTKKTYAIFCQRIEPEWLLEIAPQLLEAKEGEPYYDPHKDKVVANVAYRFKGSYSVIFEKEKEIGGEKAVETFAKALVSGQVDFPFLQKNREVIEQLNRLWIRSGGEVMEEEFTQEKLKKIYQERLTDIYTRADLEKAIEEKRVDMEIKLDDFISPQERERILRENPEKIEILEREFSIDYRYDRLENKFLAEIELKPADILKLEKIPILPSGRLLTIKVYEEGEKIVSTDSLEQLREKTREYLVSKLWERAKRENEALEERELREFDPVTQELPPLPDPLEIGKDPFTGESLFAYPAYQISYKWDGKISVWLKFFLDKKEAEKINESSLEKLENFREEKKREIEREKLTSELEKIREDYYLIVKDYKEYGLDFEKKEELKAIYSQIEKALTLERVKLEETKELLEKFAKRIKECKEYKRKKEIAKERAEKEIKRYYSKCPLCQRELKDGVCSNSEHNLDLIDFPFDEEGKEIGPVVLSQIVTENGEIIARLKCSSGRGDSYYRGDVYLERGMDIKEGGWKGEPFEEIRFEDFQKILTPEKAKERKRKIEEFLEEKRLAELWKWYEQDLAYAKEQVEKGIWKKGKFKIGYHPKTGERQWERTVKVGKKTIKYIVDRYGEQPTLEDEEYFFSVKRTLVDSRRFVLIIVQLERPFPEEKPEQKPKIKKEQGTEFESLEEAVEALKKKWGAK